MIKIPHNIYQKLQHEQQKIDPQTEEIYINIKILKHQLETNIAVYLHEDGINILPYGTSHQTLQLNQNDMENILDYIFSFMVENSYAELDGGYEVEVGKIQKESIYYPN